MYIKKIIIHGFKNRELTVVESFDPRHNVVVGKNGPGKSNLFYAFEFLFSDEYSHLHPGERQGLLHEDTGVPVISGYVEIIFDNLDGGLPIDEDEVHLKRVISFERDVYFINEHRITRSDVMLFIDEAGFFKFNPYHIIKKQMIDQMATASDSMRLKVLREVAGTTIYDDERKELKSILKETERRRQKIQEILNFTDEKLQTSEEEHNELKEYQKWDIQRRSLQYIIHERELIENKRKLEEVKNSQTTSGEEQAELSAEVQSELNRLQQNIKDLVQKITELGVRLFIFPNEESYTKFNNMSTKELLEEMEEANSHLKKYSHVTESVLDHYMAFNEQKVKLVNRKEELDRADEKLRGLMLVSDQKKCEAIRLGFEKVGKYFSEVFKKLVPSGHAQLVMKVADGDENETETETAYSDCFIGIGIRLSFTEDEGEIRDMNRLSDGQKSLVALAIIFALQKFNPVPLYLFDEIDQALDQQHRKALADMIRELSSEAQCIVTTSRPELLRHANKVYKVELRNEASHVECVTKEEAADFVDND